MCGINPYRILISIYGIYGFWVATMIPIYNWIFQNFLVGWEIQRAFQKDITWDILNLFSNVMIFFILFFFPNFPNSHEGMLSTPSILVESAQNCPSMSNSIQICLKTISFRKFEILPDFEILIFLGIKRILYEEDAAMLVHTIWILYTTIFGMPSRLSKNTLSI
jgi:hypothetical protein